MIKIKIFNIPNYLKNSEFYQNLEDEDDFIEIPKKLFKKDDTVESFEDFKKMIDISNFFGVFTYSKSLTKYYINNSNKIFEYYEKESFSPEVKNMFMGLSELKIKNIEQFIVTYKIISLYDIRIYNNFISYIINNEKEIKKLYFVSDLKFKKFIDKIQKNKTLKFDVIKKENIIKISTLIKYFFNLKNESIYAPFYIFFEINVEDKEIFMNHLYLLKNQILKNTEIDSSNKLIDSSNKFIHYFDKHLYIKWNRDCLDRIRINSSNIKQILEELDNLIKLIK